MKTMVYILAVAALMASGCRSEKEMDFLTRTPLGFFEAVSHIPRTSGNERAISDFYVDFDRSLGLEVIQDDVLNVLIRKNGTAGWEHEPLVILQAHIDMVGEKNADSPHNFLTDPLRLIVQDDSIF